jgi:glycosyltransferase involved in cell wall biosynthesis
VVGDGGVLVADGDVHAACVAVLDLLRDDDARAQVGWCGRMRAARAFDWSVCAEAHAQAYRAVLKCE